jgi:hypothetical protein
MDGWNDEMTEFIQVIDSLRTVGGNTTDKNSVVLSMEDPQTIAVVEMQPGDLDDLIENLTKLKKMIGRPRASQNGRTERMGV